MVEPFVSSFHPIVRQECVCQHVMTLMQTLERQGLDHPPDTGNLPGNVTLLIEAQIVLRVGVDVGSYKCMLFVYLWLVLLLYDSWQCPKLRLCGEYPEFHWW
jgi:hypothetical protein